MKIIHLCNYFQPQLGYQEAFLAKEHSLMGHDVFVITSDRFFQFPDYDNTIKPILGSRITGSGVIDYFGCTVIKLNVLFEFHNRVWLLGLIKRIKEIKPDLIICHGISNFNALRVSYFKRTLGFKFLLDDHMLWSEENNGFLGTIFYKLFNFRKISKAADRIIGVADECVDFIHKKYHFPLKRIEMIPLGADADLFKFNPALRAKFRKSYNIEPEEIVITYTGKLTLRKGPHHILMALNKIENRFDERVIVCFVGNMAKDYEELMCQWIEKVGVTLRVIRIMAVPNNQLVEIYSGSELAVWPRQGSMSMIEASSCGIPIICCDFLTERYKKGNGVPIVEDDIDSLGKALLLLIRDKEKRKIMGEMGRQLIENEMSWKVIADRFITINEQNLT